MDDVVHFVHQGHRRSQIPAPTGAVSERAWAHPGLVPCASGEQPVEKQHEIIAITPVPERPGRAALA